MKAGVDMKDGARVVAEYCRMQSGCTHLAFAACSTAAVLQGAAKVCHALWLEAHQFCRLECSVRCDGQLAASPACRWTGSSAAVVAAVLLL